MPVAGRIMPDVRLETGFDPKESFNAPLRSDRLRTASYALFPLATKRLVKS